MIMEDLFDFEKTSKKPKAQVIKGDFIDKLHGRTTISFLFGLLVLIVFRQGLYSKISCWYPTRLSDQQGDYLTEFCWINSTYLLPEEYDSENYDAYHHNEHSIPYYQYILFILIGQILMFYLPSKIWHIFSVNSDGYMSKLLEISSASFNVTNKETSEFKTVFKSLNKRNRRQKINEEENDIKSNQNNGEDLIVEKSNEDVKLYNKKSVNSSRKSNSSIDQNFKQKLVSSLNPMSGIKGFTVKYLLFKLVNLINVIGQFFIINIIFRGKFLYYGFVHVIKLLNAQNPLLMTKSFPVYTLCDFFVYEPNRKTQEYTVQCILPMNVLLEKFYILIWFWLIFLSLVTTFNLASWIYELSFSQTAFLKKYLDIQFQMLTKDGTILTDHLVEDGDEIDKEKLILLKSSISKNDENDIESFQNDYLGIDGISMLFIVKNVSGDVAFIKLLGVLYNDFHAVKIN